jgi:hypothetical protein
VSGELSSLPGHRQPPHQRDRPGTTAADLTNPSCLTTTSSFQTSLHLDTTFHISELTKSLAPHALSEIGPGQVSETGSPRLLLQV